MKETQEKYEQLWTKVLQNDLQALELIYKHFYSDLYHYALKLTTDAVLAENVIQDTFLYLWQHRTQIGVIHSLPFYLFRSIRNNSLKLIKEQKRLISFEGNQTLADLKIQPEELELVDSSDEVKTMVENALTDLSSRQREIILLRFYDNLDYEEIGQILDINYQSVVNHVHRAIIKLRKSTVLKFLKNTLTILF